MSEDLPLPDEEPTPSGVSFELESYPPLPPPLPRVPHFSPVVTVICGLLILGGLIAVAFGTSEPLAELDDPGRAVVRLYERSLDVEEAEKGTPLSKAFDEGGDTAAEAEAAWRETIRWIDTWEGYDPEDADRVRAHLVVLLGEQGRFAEAEEDLAVLEASSSSSSSHLPEGPAFVRAARAAYGGGEAMPESLSEGLPEDLPEGLPAEGWARRRLEARLRGSEPVPDTAAAARGAADTRIWTGFAALVLVGLLLAALFLFVPRFRHAPASGRVPGPWPRGDGYAVLVRGPLLGMGVLIGVSAVGYVVSDTAGDAALLFASLLLFLPCVFLVVRYLLRPYRIRLSDAFGLRASPGHLGWLLLAGLATLAVDQVGGLGIAHACLALGFESHWSEGVAEEMFYGSTTEAVLSGIDAAVWAPLFEEILFRGVLYATLRIRFKPLPAALASAALFSAIHLYSWPGFFVILWSGLVWAWAYERTRSLWPTIFAHAMHNFVLVVHVFAIYR